MTKLKTASAGLLLGVAMVISAQSQTFTPLGSFNGIDGANPFLMDFVQGDDGSLYGTATQGGSSTCAGGCGTVLKISLGHLEILHTFCAHAPCLDGISPYAGLIEATDGNFYGTTNGGGTNGFGTIFRIARGGGVLTALYSFCAEPNCTDGAYPQSRLLQASDGNLYGTTGYGGGATCPPDPSGCGTVFRITLQGRFTTLHSFGVVDGYEPIAGLIQGIDGNLYGTSQLGGTGTPDWGTVFKMTLRGKVTTLYSFCTQPGCGDGGQPYAAVIQGADGDFYGTTTSGGDNQQGAVYRITSDGQFTTLHSFLGGTDGTFPSASLVQATDGNLYGTAANFGLNGGGTIFAITPGGDFTNLYSFCMRKNCIDGQFPFGGLLQDTNGVLYGTTRDGGFGYFGVIYSLDMGLAPFVTFVRPAGKVGQIGPILGQGFTGTTSVMLNGVPANFKVISDTYIKATVPSGATTGYVTVTTPSGVLTSNVPFHVIQ
jgi:uncharacterized repeat protein (TIGR03803 family)